MEKKQKTEIVFVVKSGYPTFEDVDDNLETQI